MMRHIQAKQRESVFRGNRSSRYSRSNRDKVTGSPQEREVLQGGIQLNILLLGEIP